MLDTVFNNVLSQLAFKKTHEKTEYYSINKSTKGYIVLCKCFSHQK